MEMEFADKVRWLRGHFNPYSKRWYYESRLRTEQIFEREYRKELRRKTLEEQEKAKKVHDTKNDWIGEWVLQNYGCNSSALTISQKKEVISKIAQGQIVAPVSS